MRLSMIDRGAFHALDRFEDQLPHSWPGEDGLRHNREGHQRTEFETKHGDDRDQDVLQQVHADHPVPRQALGARITNGASILWCVFFERLVAKRVHEVDDEL